MIILHNLPFVLVVAGRELCTCTPVSCQLSATIPYLSRPSQDVYALVLIVLLRVVRRTHRTVDVSVILPRSNDKNHPFDVLDLTTNKWFRQSTSGEYALRKAQNAPRFCYKRHYISPLVLQPFRESRIGHVQQCIQKSLGCIQPAAIIYHLFLLPCRYIWAGLITLLGIIQQEQSKVNSWIRVGFEKLVYLF